MAFVCFLQVFSSFNISPEKSNLIQDKFQLFHCNQNQPNKYINTHFIPQFTEFANLRLATSCRFFAIPRKKPNQMKKVSLLYNIY